MSERKRSGAWVRGQDDGWRGVAPDYSQATTEQLLDYLDGYKKGQRERKESK